MVRATGIKKGMVLNVENDLFLVIEYEHLTPGNKRAIHQVKMKNLKTGAQKQMRLSTSDSFEEAYLEKKSCQYLYKEGDRGMVFMNTEDSEHYTADLEVIGEAKNFIPEGATVTLVFYENQPISVELPASVVLEVTQAEDAVKGNSVTNLQKNAVLETGYTVKVPLHIKTGDKVKVSTETGEFLGRSND